MKYKQIILIFFIPFSNLSYKSNYFHPIQTECEFEKVVRLKLFQ